MTAILRRAPFYEEPTEVTVGDEQVIVRPFQIIVWVSVLASGKRSPRLPAVLDTAFNLTFAIVEPHLRTWVGLDPAELATIGRTRINKQYLELKRADVALHRNVRGERDRLTDQQPFELPLREGIAVYPPDHPQSPRLPLLGMRALVRNDLRLTIDGKRKTVNLDRLSRWFGN
jgi:hypothetical protein